MKKLNRHFQSWSRHWNSDFFSLISGNETQTFQFRSRHWDSHLFSFSLGLDIEIQRHLQSLSWSRHWDSVIFSIQLSLLPICPVPKVQNLCNLLVGIMGCCRTLTHSWTDWAAKALWASALIVSNTIQFLTGFVFFWGSVVHQGIFQTKQTVHPVSIIIKQVLKYV